MSIDSKDARLARAILRVIQRNPEGIQRTQLTVQIRPYGDQVFRVLDDLIRAGIVKEDAIVLRPDAEKNRRAALSYHLAEPADGNEHPLFDDLDAPAVAEYLSNLAATA